MNGAARCVTAALLGACCLLWSFGCESSKRREPPPEPAPAAAPPADPVLSGTVGAYTYLGDAVAQPVSGFGIVIGLGDRGSGDCPTTIREYLVETMMKEAETWGSLEQRKKFSPGEHIDSLATAVVQVSGLVPAGAVKGARFDLRIDAIPGTSTRSLRGGLLLPCELRVPDPSGSLDSLLAGAIVARAGGPVYIDPFRPEAKTAPAVAERTGWVLGGGQTLEARDVRLLLREPSYPLARRLEERLNERFGQRPKVAEAMSQGYLELKTPPEYAARPSDFLQLLTHVFADTRPIATEEKLRELAVRITQPGVDPLQISLVWEGFGAGVLPALQPFYAHENLQVRFAAVRAGLRLGDVTALPIMSALVGSSDEALALAAVAELTRCSMPQAATDLVPLLDHERPEMRIAAYEGLLRHRHPAVESLALPSLLDPQQINLILDVVESNGEPLIFIRRSRLPRIAVFNPRARLFLPLFYSDARDSVMLNASGDAADITVLMKRAGRLTEPLLVPPRVVDLIRALADVPLPDATGRLRGIGLCYSEVVEILAALSEDKTIPATLEVEAAERPDLEPRRTPSRPETDEAESDDALILPGEGP